MSNQDSRLAATLAAIETACDGRWGVWMSDTGWCWAARTVTLASDQLSAGGVQFLQADNPEELAERIRQQDKLTCCAITGTSSSAGH